VPRSGRQTCVRDKSGMLKCFLKSPPEKNKANNELVKLVANLLDMSASSVLLVGGLTSRTKRLAIQCPLTEQEIIAKLTAT